MDSVFWNIRGLNSKEKQLDVKNFLKKHAAPIISLVETKVDYMNTQAVCRSILPQYQFISHSLRGRIWILWDRTLANVESISFTEQFLHCKVLNNGSSVGILMKSATLMKRWGVVPHTLEECLDSTTASLHVIFKTFVLPNLKRSLKNWNKVTFGSIQNHLQHCRTRLDKAQADSLNDPLNPALHLLESSAKEDYLQALRREEVLLRQKSRQLWLREGDKNSKFFYASLKSRAAFNTIRKVQLEDGSYSSDPGVIKRHASQFFHNLLNRENTSLIHPLSPSVKLSEVERQNLCAPVSDAEIRSALFSAKALSSPGPDGFPARFFQVYWNVVKEDFISAIKSFFISGFLLRQLNHSFISLIPKTKHADSFDNFRPISLCNSVYKTITKIMSERLQGVLPKLVLPNQSAFVKGRNIVHNTMLAHELVRYLGTSSSSGRACVKVDLRKAFDSVRWDFLKEVLNSLNFPGSWVQLILQCVQTASFSVLVNGSPVDFFQAKCGLRQGDPLSPLLFVLVMNALSHSIEEAVNSGRLGRFINSAHNISHLCFADDLIIFTDCSHASAIALQLILSDFSKASGLSLNPSKSQLFTSNDGNFLSTGLGIPICQLPVKHLGLPLQSSYLSNASCSPLVDKVRKRLQVWTAIYLSKAGRVELINSVLINLSFYWTAGFSLPKKTVKTIEQICRRFLWAGEEGRMKLHAVSWADVCLPRAEGGLGIKRVSEWNLAALGTRLWEIATNNQSLWASWIKKRYCRRNTVWNASPSSSDSPLWKKILNTAQWLRVQVQYIIFEGTTINLWEDPWLKGFGLKHHFNGQTNLHWGPPNSTPVASLIHAGKWKKPIHWPAGFDAIWEAINELEIGGCGSDILIWTGSKTGQGAINDGEKMILQFILALTIWTIWQARNEKIFRQCALSKPLLVRKIILATKSRFSGVSIEDSGSPLSLALLSLFGIVLEANEMGPSPPGWVKINSDGSLGEDRYGFGAVVRDSRGDCLLAMAERSQAASINILELKGLLAGMRLQNLPGSLVWSESDSTTVVAWALDLQNGRSLMSIEKVIGWQMPLRHGNPKLVAPYSDLHN
ncbi:hypothetical protein QJS10_CPB13g01231 [Acorus calamus]|uniref:Reverse transcriptase domain-containing protein n=1 Tax=Acorus calamus TaxID=4465 RepID=A0AAV9DGA9_ACOCL|nr:hypothetical protein QJS10_CPB13g01231 [Acorus calamus]